jgi:hypothetical protein
MTLRGGTKQPDWRIILPNSSFSSGGLPPDFLLGGSGYTGQMEQLEKRYFDLLSDLLPRLRNEYDYVIVDTRGGSDFSSKAAASLADAYTIIVEADPISLNQVSGLEAAVSEFGIRYRCDPKFRGFIANKALFKQKDDAQFKAMLEGRYPGDLLGVIPFDPRAVDAYQNLTPTFLRSPDASFSWESLKALEKLADCGRLSQTDGFKALRARIKNAWWMLRGVKRADALYPFVVAGIFGCLLIVSGFVLFGGFSLKSHLMIAAFALFYLMLISTLVMLGLRFWRRRSLEGEGNRSGPVYWIAAGTAIALAVLFFAASLQVKLVQRLDESSQEKEQLSRATADLSAKTIALNVANTNLIDQNRDLVASQEALLKIVQGKKGQPRPIILPRVDPRPILASENVFPVTSPSLPAQPSEPKVVVETDWQRALRLGMGSSHPVSCMKEFEGIDSTALRSCEVYGLQCVVSVAKAKVAAERPEFRDPTSAYLIALYSLCDTPPLQKQLIQSGPAEVIRFLRGLP